MGSSRLQRRIALRRKLHIHRALNTTKSHNVKRSSTLVNVMDTFLYICLLKLKLEAVKREHSNLLATKRQCLNQLIENLHEVKVEKTEEGTFDVKVRCEKGEDTLVSVLEALEEMGLVVLHAGVSCEDKWFSMEATVVAQTNEDQVLNVKDVRQAIAKAIDHQKQEICNQNCMKSKD